MNGIITPFEHTKWTRLIRGPCVKKKIVGRVVDCWLVLRWFDCPKAMTGSERSTRKQVGLLFIALIVPAH